MTVNPGACSRHGPGNRRQDQETRDHQCRYDKRPAQVEQDVQRAPTDQVDVLAVVFGTVVRASVMIDMGVVNEGRNQEGDSAGQIPNKAEDR